MKAKNRFCLMFDIVARLSRRARTMPRRSPLTSVTPALSIATSVPVPIAMPTWAFASHGDKAPLVLQPLDHRGFLIRQHLGQHFVDPKLRHDGFGRDAAVARH